MPGNFNFVILAPEKSHWKSYLDFIKVKAGPKNANIFGNFRRNPNYNGIFVTGCLE